MATSDARPIPRRNVAYRVYFPIYKNDGTLITTWTGMDSQVSMDGGNYAACTNEATEIQTSGTGYLDLTAAEMDADAVLVIVSVTNTDALPVVVALYPQEDTDIRVNLIEVDGNTSRVTTLASQLDNDTLGDVRTITDKLDTTLEADDTLWMFTEASLANAPSSGGGGSDAWITDLSGSFAADTAGAYQKAIYARTANLGSGTVYQQSQISNTKLTARCYTTLREIFTITDADTATDIWFTLKRFLADTDEDALLQVSLNGLVRINGAAPDGGDVGKASITAVGDVVTIEVDADIMGLLPAGTNGVWDVKYRESDDDVFVAYGGTASIVQVVTRATD